MKVKMLLFSQQVKRRQKITGILISSSLMIVLCYGCAQSIHSNYSPPVEQNLIQQESKLPESQLSENQSRIIQKSNLINQSEPNFSNDKSDVKMASLHQTLIIPPDRERYQQSSKSEETKSHSQKIQLLLDEALDSCQASQDLWQKGELEYAIEALDHAYALILKADGEDLSLEFLQQKEDLRFTISKRILEIYASRNIVANGSHDTIPLIMNRHVKSEIHSFTKGREKEFFRESYRRSGRYRHKIVYALKEAGLPVELSWLPLIESGFKVNALSPARALGLWQFIPSTGYKFGLKRDYYIDERLNPEKSTKAAIAYLKALHQIFGDWTTVLAAYNWGEHRVLRVIRSQNVNYLDNFWDLYKRIPRETARYVPRFLATLHIIKHPEKYGINTITIDKPLEYETVSIANRVHLRDVAKMIGTSKKAMRELNPDLRYKILPPRKYSLKVPVGKKNILIAKLDEIPVTSKPKEMIITHRVKRGETISTIAEKYRVGISAIVRTNNINRRNYIIAGQTLKIPKKGAVSYKPQKYKRPKKTHSHSHVVKRGDSLWIIAKRYGTTTQQIIENNRLHTTRLHIGQVLMISQAGYKATAGEGLKIYHVRRGDNPFYIAKRHNMDLEQFLRINRLTPKSKIFPGQRLFVE